MASVGKLTADLIARTKKFEAGMERGKKKIRTTGRSARTARKDVKRLGQGFQGLASRAKMLGGALLGIAGIGGFGALSRSALEAANQVDRASKRLGVSTDTFQDFTNAAKAADIQTNVSEMGLQRFTRRLGEAQAGGGELLGTLQKYNIALHNSDGTARNTMAVLGDLADTIKGAGTAQERLAISFKAFDSEGADLVRILAEGKEGLKEFVRVGNEEFDKFDKNTIEALSRADATIRAFKSRATIRVGELIAGEANFAAIKEMGFRLMAVAGRFGGGIRDHIRALGNVIQAGLGGSFDYVVDRLRRKLCEISLDIAEKDPFINADEFAGMVEKHRESFKAPKKNWEQFFEDRIIVEKSLADEYGSYWTAKADEQRKLLDTARKVAEPGQEKFAAVVAQANAANPAASVSGATSMPKSAPRGSMSKTSAGGFDPGFSSAGDFLDGAKRVTSDMLRRGLEKLQSKADELRRGGDFSGADDLLDQRFGIRRQISATRSQERIDGITSGETSFNASGINSNQPRGVEQNTARIAELNSRNNELLEIISNEMAG